MTQVAEMGTSNPSNAERFGRWLGRLRRGYTRRERGAVDWLVNRGMPTPAASALLWAIKLGVLAVLFYIAFWLALLFVFVLIAAWTASRTATSEESDFLAACRTFSKND